MLWFLAFASFIEISSQPSSDIVNSIESTIKLAMRWEYLGQKVIPNQPIPFVSETNSILHLLSMEIKKRNQNCDFHIIREENMAEDIKNMIGK